jgi:acyl-coenzyme A thioesterase PaaI-like protein
MSEPLDDALPGDLLADAPDNVFARIARRHAGRAPTERRRLLTRDVGEAIPFTGTAGLGVALLRPTRVAVTLAPGRATQNHIGGTHAAALALLAETATGLIVAQNVPSGSAPVLRSLGVDFECRAEGALRAEAQFPAEEARRIRARPVGKVEAPVTVTDAGGREPIRAALDWAWLPRDRAGL